MNGRRGTAVGVAIGPERLVARGSGIEPLEWEHSLAGSGTEWRDHLYEAFRSLRSAAGDARRLNVTLMPPLAAVRVVELPIAAGSDLRPAIARDVSKYFPVGNERQVVQVHTIVRAADTGIAPQVVSTAGEQLVEDVLSAARASGWSVASLSAAPFAWVSAAREFAASRNEVRIAVRADDRDHVFGIRNLSIVRVQTRRMAAAETVEAHVVARTSDEAYDIAARYAALPDAHSLWPDRVYADRTRSTWKRTGAFAAAAVALVVVAAGLEWNTAGRNLARLAGARAALRSRVAVANIARDSLQRLEQRVVLLRSFDSNARRWSDVIGTLAAALPRDASLTSVTAAGDTLTIVGDAHQAATVFSALGQVPTLTRIRADGPIQQQVENGEVIGEQFRIAAQLTPRVKR